MPTTAENFFSTDPRFREYTNPVTGEPYYHVGRDWYLGNTNFTDQGYTPGVGANSTGVWKEFSSLPGFEPPPSDTASEAEWKAWTDKFGEDALTAYQNSNEFEQYVEQLSADRRSSFRKKLLGLGAIAGGALLAGGALGGAGAASGSTLQPITTTATPLTGGVAASDALLGVGGLATPGLVGPPSALAGAAAGGAAGATAGGLLSPVTSGAQMIGPEAITGQVGPPTALAPAGVPGSVPGASLGSLGVGGSSGGVMSGIGDFISNNPSLVGGALGFLDSALAPDSETTTSDITGTNTSNVASSRTTGATTNPALMPAANQILGSIPGMEYQAAGFNPMQQGAADTFGHFADPNNINPYLDTVFDAAANRTQSHLDTQFAHAGRLNSGSHQQDRSQQLQQLAAGIYGPGYNAAANRAVTSGNQLLGAGNVMQQTQQNQLNAPLTTLDMQSRALSGISPYFPGTTNQTTNVNQTGTNTQQGSNTVPLYNSPFAGALGGAMAADQLFGGQQPITGLTGQNFQPYQNTTYGTLPYSGYGFFQ